MLDNLEEKRTKVESKIQLLNNTKGFLKISVSFILMTVFIDSLLSTPTVSSVVNTNIASAIYIVAYVMVILSLATVFYSLMTAIFPVFFNRYKRLIITPPKFLDRIANF